MPKVTKLIIAPLLVIVLIVFISGTLGCQKSNSEEGLNIIKQAWNIIFSEYVDRDILNIDDMSETAIEGMLEILDDPDTPEVEGENYRPRLSNIEEKGLDNIVMAWDIIFQDYRNQNTLDFNALSHAAIQGIVESIDDPYTSFLEAEHFELGLSSLEGEFDGIGAYVTVQDKQLMIIAPIADSPADKAGIKAGDIILEIDGEPVDDMSLAEAIIKIRGPKGTPVTLFILHEGETEPEEIEIIRARVEVPSVRFEMEGNIAYINITQFSERTYSELSSVFDELDQQATRAIILDLRGNPGGLLDTVVEVTSRFLYEGVIVKIRSNQGNTSTISVDTKVPTTDLPMVVLVGKASASGSEVLAGALQDHDRAFIAGNTTYGKGSVNVLRELDDGSGLYITTARWLTPNGYLIEGQGIKPDKELEVNGEDAIQWALDYLTGNK